MIFFNWIINWFLVSMILFVIFGFIATLAGFGMKILLIVIPTGAVPIIAGLAASVGLVLMVAVKLREQR